MLSKARKRYEEKAKGDGNCAFNAFMLGFCDAAVLENIQLADDSYFVTEASNLLHISPASWRALKSYFLSPNTSRAELQTQFAPLLRKIAIGFINTNSDEREKHLQLTMPAIQVELENYFQERRKKSKNKISVAVVGDIFIRHAFIKNKFEELFLANKNNADAALAAIALWWQEQGYQQFLQAMTQPAVYAGDLELAALGQFFGVNVHVQSGRRRIDTQIYHANGKLPDALREHERTLADREIIYNNDLSWKTLSQKEVENRLQAVPQSQQVLAYISRTDAALKKNDPVPQVWGSACVEQLRIRGVVNHNSQTFAMDVNPAIVAPRITEHPQMDAIVQAWKSTYHQAPTIILQNESAAHWNNLRLEPVAPEKAKAVPEKAKAVPKKAALYKPSRAEREVNDAVNEAFDLLNANRPPLDDAQVQKKFEAVFDQFSSMFDNFKNKKIDLGFFKQRKQEILDNVKAEIAQIKKINRSPKT